MLVCPMTPLLAIFRFELSTVRSEYSRRRHRRNRLHMALSLVWVASNGETLLRFEVVSRPCANFRSWPIHGHLDLVVASDIRAYGPIAQNVL